MKRFLSYALLLLIFMGSGHAQVQFRTLSVEEVGTNYINVKGEIAGDGIVQHGVIVSTHENPTLQDEDIVIRVVNTVSYTLFINGLIENTSYVVRAYAKVGNETLYSNTVFFTTRGTSSFYTINNLDAGTRKPSFVDVMVQVLDDKGRGVDYFRNKDFQVLEDGEDNQSTEIHKYIRPLEEIPFDINTMLVLDYTSSLNGGGQDGFAKIKQAASNLVRNKMPNQKFALVVFYGTNPNVLVSEFTDDIELLINKINSIERPGNTTSLFDAYIQGLDLLQTDYTSTEYIRKNFMVVFTDGLDVLWGSEAGTARLNEAVAKRNAGGYKVFTIGMYGSDISSEAALQQDYVLEKLASSREDFYPNVDINNIQGVFSKIQMEIRREANSFYRLSYMTPKRGGSHTLKLKISGKNTVSSEYSFSASNFGSVNYGIYVEPYSSFAGAGNPYGLKDDTQYSFTSDKTFRVVSYWPDVVPTYSFVSSDTSIIKVEQTGFEQFKLSATGKSGKAVVTITDRANYNYVASGQSATIASYQAAVFKKTFEIVSEDETLSITQKKIGFTVSFATGGGIPVPVTQFVTDGKAQMPALEPEKEGYKFTGWYSGGRLWNFDAVLGENITLTAGWAERPHIALTTQTPTSISQNSALFAATVTGQTEGFQLGFFYDDEYGKYRHKVISEVVSDKVTATVNNLVAGKTYYVQAFAIKGPDTVWGNQIMFTTRPTTEYYRLQGYPPASTQKPYFVDFLFSVKDNQGRGVDYLEDIDFVLKNGDVVTSKTSEFFRYVRKMDAIPFKIKTILIIDNSSSISYKDMESLKQAAIDLVKSKHEKQEFAVYSFSESALLETDFTANVDSLVQYISQIQMGYSTTGLYESYIKAMNKLPEEYTTKDSIMKCFVVLLSDGDETKNKYTSALESSAVSARGNKTAYTIGFGQDLKPARLRALASSSFNYYPAENLSEVTRIFKNIQYTIMREANSFYNLTCLTDKRRQHGQIAVEITVNGNTNSDKNTNCYKTSYQSIGEGEDDIFWFGSYLNIYKKVEGVSIAALNKYGLGLPDELSSRDAYDTVSCRNLAEDFVLQAVTYGTYVKPEFVWTSSRPDVVDVEGYDFDKARLIYKNESEGDVVITVTDASNWRAVADYTYGGVVQPSDSSLYRRSIYVRNVPMDRPVFTVASGKYQDSVRVEITCSPRSSILYSVDGGEPVTAYKGSFCLKKSAVVRAVATRGGRKGEEVAAYYLISPSQPPVYTEARLFVERINGGSDMYSLKDNPVLGFADTAFRLVCGNGSADYPLLATRRYYFEYIEAEAPAPDTVEAPVFVRHGGQYFNSVQVAIACSTKGAFILYKLKGETEYRPYTGAFYLYDSAEVEAYAVRADMENSDTVSVRYDVTRNLDPSAMEKVITPVFADAGGVYRDSVWMSLSCYTQGATIMYRLDREGEFIMYNGAFYLYDTSMVEAYAFKSDMVNSDTVEAVYYVAKTPEQEPEPDPEPEPEIPDTVAAPVFAYPGGEYQDSVWVLLSCSTQGATVMYRLNKEGVFTVYVGSFYLYDTTMVEAYAFKSDMVNSDTVEAVYYVAKTPEQEPEPGPSVANENFPSQVLPFRFIDPYHLEIDGVDRVSLYDMAGRILRRVKADNGGTAKINLQGLPTGVFLLKAGDGRAVKIFCK